MVRSVSLLTVSLLLCFTLLGMDFLKAEEKSPPVKDPVLYVKFIGNEAFRLSDGKVTVFSDFPYQSGAYGYMEYEYPFEAERPGVISLISHRHLDHFDPALFTELEWKLIGPLEIVERHSRLKIIPLEPRVALGNLVITPKATEHANTEHYSYLMDWAGKQLYFTGDTNDAQSLKDLPELDMLFITPWLYHSAQESGLLPKAARTVIYHHKTGEIVPGCKGCIIPEQGQEFILQ